MKENEPQQPRFAIIEPLSHTHTPDGTETHLHIHGSDEQTEREVAREIGAVPVYNRDKDNNPTSSTSVGLGGTKWNSSWKPEGDVARATRAVAIAKQRGAQPTNPTQN